ncbi:hypothetical protein IJG79_02940 [Candidatus Saccharibacteria bacterium]|nr:hypothetical protein [Candidatus Saccharibacteria bacterium]
MIYVFYGSDRLKISQEIKKFFGEEYEIFNGENLTADDIPNLFLGRSLFANQRKILIKDITPARGESSKLANTLGERDFYELAMEYTDTPHDIVIWETNISPKKGFKDFISNSQVVAKKYDQTPQIDMRKVFGIYNTALVDGARAVKMLNEIKDQEDPFMFVGLLSTQVIKSYEKRQGRKEKRALRELSKLDIAMKSTNYDPWVLISSFLLQVSLW